MDFPTVQIKQKISRKAEASGVRASFSACEAIDPCPAGLLRSERVPINADYRDPSVNIMPENAYVYCHDDIEVVKKAIEPVWNDIQSLDDSLRNAVTFLLLNTNDAASLAADYCGPILRLREGFRDFDNFFAFIAAKSGNDNNLGGDPDIARAFRMASASIDGMADAYKSWDMETGKGKARLVVALNEAVEDVETLQKTILERKAGLAARIRDERRKFDEMFGAPRAAAHAYIDYEGMRGKPGNPTHILILHENTLKKGEDPEAIIEKDRKMIEAWVKNETWKCELLSKSGKKISEKVFYGDDMDAVDKWLEKSLPKQQAKMRM